LTRKIMGFQQEVKSPDPNRALTLTVFHMFRFETYFPRTSPNSGQARGRLAHARLIGGDRPMQRQQKITLGEMRQSGVTRFMIYCADYNCTHSIVVDASRDHRNRS
jgi:hypothetical protein